MDSTIIEVKGLNCRVDRTTILHHADFTAKQHAITAIVGPSGCGKTTLLRSIIGLWRPTSGTVKVFGKNMLKCKRADIEAVRMRWGILFQHAALFSSLSILDNIAFPMRILAGLDKDLSTELAMLKLKMVGLPERAAWLYPSELSGGMQKRAGLARALALDPELLLLDEPTSGLDPQSSQGFNRLLLELRRTLGLTVVMVTHDLVSLKQIADSIAVLGDKQVLQQGSLATIERSRAPLVRSFFDAYHQGVKQVGSVS